MKTTIIGGGAWGTALAIVQARKQQGPVSLWAHEAAVVEGINNRHENSHFLPGIAIPALVQGTTSLEEALAGAHIVISVMPSQHCRSVMAQAAPYLSPESLIVSATKGVEEGTLLRMSQVIAEVVQQERGFVPSIGALSGPSFAKEAAKGDPTALAIASFDDAFARTVQTQMSDSSFRVYTNRDVAGVELGGALKNVIAIAAGVCHGLGLGHNSAAALITRGLAEITRLAVACGGHPETLAGLAGLGDLVLTCTGDLSRNRSVGVALGQGRKLAEIVAGMEGKVAEGVLTVNAAVGLAQRHHVEMPITQQMYAVLHDGKPPREAIHELMTRSAKKEA